MGVEVDGTVVDGIDDDCSGSVVAGAGNRSNERVEEQVSANPVALLGLVKGKPGQQENGDRIGLAAPRARRHGAVVDAAHRQRVVADNPFPATDHPGCRSARGRGDCRGVLQPVVKLTDPASEGLEIVVGGVEQFEWAKRRLPQEPGIWL